MSEKFDAPLRMKLRQIESAGQQDTSVPVFIEAVDAPTDEQLHRLEDLGLVVHSVVGRVVTATGTPTAIRQAASLDVVASISLSQTRPRSGNKSP